MDKAESLKLTLRVLAGVVLGVVFGVCRVLVHAKAASATMEVVGPEFGRGIVLDIILCCGLYGALVGLFAGLGLAMLERKPIGIFGAEQNRQLTEPPERTQSRATPKSARTEIIRDGWPE